MPRLVCILFFFGGVFLTARAQVTFSDAMTARSRSGQFIVVASRTASSPPQLLDLATNRDFVCLEPALLAVSSERIKQVLWRLLDTTASWRGKVYLTLHPATSAEDTVTVTAERFRDAWQYRVDLPEVAQRARYVRAMVQVVLLELANRQSASRSAELPLWLSEGLARQVLVTSEKEIILQPPRATARGLMLEPTFVSAQRQNPLSRAHQELSARAPLTFEELSWPGPDPLTGEAGERYRSSAQLFVNELLALKGGPACLRAMLEELPQHYNWQLALLHAFGARFQAPLEVEKWWALRTAQFTGRDLAQTWPADESWQRLDQCLRPSVAVRTGANEMPLRAEMTLQNLLREGDPARLTDALQARRSELQLLRPRLSPQVAGVADQYCQVLDACLIDRGKSGLIPFRKQAAQRHAAAQAIQRFDELDTLRRALQPRHPRNNPGGVARE